MQYLQIPFLDIPVCDISWWHWLLAMLVPFLLGYLVRYFLNSRFKAKIAALETEKAELEAGLKKAKSLKAAAAPVVVSADKGEVNSLKDKVRDLEAHNTKLKADIAEALAVKQQFAGVNIDKLNSRIAELEAAEARLASDLSSQRSLNASLTANTGDLDALKAKLGSAQDEIIRLTAQVNALKADLAGITRENDNINGLRSDIRDLSGKVGALTVENERLKQQAAAAVPADTGALDALRARLEAAENEAAGLKATIAGLQATNSSLQASAASAAAGSEAAAKNAEELAGLKAKLADAGIEAGNLRLRLEQVTAEAAGLKTQAEGCGAENAELKAKLAALEGAGTSFAAAAPLAAAEPAKPDDLKIVEGIGPKIEELFNAAGIFTFKQLYATPVEQLKQILNEAGPRFQIHDPSTWPEQARLADEGKMDELKALQDRLNAGKE